MKQGPVERRKRILDLAKDPEIFDPRGIDIALTDFRFILRDRAALVTINETPIERGSIPQGYYIHRAWYHGRMYKTITAKPKDFFYYNCTRR